MFFLVFSYIDFKKYVLFDSDDLYIKCFLEWPSSDGPRDFISHLDDPVFHIQMVAERVICAYSHAVKRLFRVLPFVCERDLELKFGRDGDSSRFAVFWNNKKRFPRVQPNISHSC